MAEPTTIHIHAFVTLPCGAQEHCYPGDEGDLPLAWSIYRRIPTPSDPQQPFDIVDEADFDAQADAIAAATMLADRHGINPADIEHDY